MTTAVLEVRQIPLAAIVPSPNNPRKSFDQAQLNELAASIKAVGVQVPLSLRFSLAKVVQTYEIVGGERRWRAAQLAGLKTVPAIVREMSDEQELVAFLGIEVKGRDWEAPRKAIDAALGKVKDQELEGWLADVLAVEAVMPSGGAERKQLWNIGKLLGVDCDAIAAKAEQPAKKVTAKFSPNAKAPAKAKPARAAAAKKAGKP